MILGMHTPMQQARAEQAGGMTLCLTLVLTATKLKIWVPTRCEIIMSMTSIIIQVGLVLLMDMGTATCMRVKLMISPSILLHLHSTHKDVTCS